MQVKVRLSPADLETFRHRATVTRSRIETVLEEIVSNAACDLRRPIRCRVSRQDVERRREEENGLTWPEAPEE